jgi:hypothetical protein
MTASRSGGRALPPLLPRPRQIERTSGSFVLREDLPIALGPGADDRDFETARALRRGVEQRTGVALAIEGHFDASDLERAISLRVDTSFGSKLPPEIAPQAYRLEVQPDAIRVSGGGSPGLRHGVETLLQLVRADGRIPACHITDSPDLERRGVMLDISRGKVPTDASLRALIDLCVRLKLNVLMLYTEHTFRFRRHPEIGRDDSPLDAESLRSLDAYAAQHCVELVPCLQSLGHMEHVLKLPAYRALAETERGWTIAPNAPGTLELLRELYDEYLPNFRSELFNANCDEPWDLGQGQSAERSRELGPGGLYLEHIGRLMGLASRHDKRMMIWGDVVHDHPERIPEIPRDLMLLDWWYEAELDYDRVAVFPQNGLEFMVCPGTSSWNCLFPRVENSRLNISRWADAGRRHGARGLINTDWGDGGHYNLQGNSYFAYAWGAQEAWSGTCEAADFDRAFSRCVFGDGSGAIARLYRALGAIHAAGFTIFNGSSLQYLFFDDVGSAYFVAAGKPAVLTRSERRLSKLRAGLDATLDRAELEPLAVDELRYAADATLFAVRKGLAGRDYVDWRRKPRSLGAAERRKLARRLEALGEEQVALGKRLRRLWHARARPSNHADTHRRLLRSARALRKAARALERNRPPAAPADEPLTPAGVLRASLVP